MHNLEQALRGGGCNAEVERAGYAAVSEISSMRAEIERLTEQLEHSGRERAAFSAEIDRLLAAIRSTATQGTFDEIAIRKAVGFELAELICDMRSHQQQPRTDERS